MATQNPIEQEGTYPLPEAQLDRFLFKALVGFPPADDVVEILKRTTAGAEAEPSPVMDGAAIVEMSAMVRDLPAGSHLLHYAATLVEATHPESELAPDSVRRYVRNGASPRGAQALVLGGKAFALAAGRPNLAAEDIWKVAPMSLRHRLVLGYEAMADGIRADQIVTEVLEAHPRPQPAVPSHAALGRASRPTGTALARYPSTGDRPVGGTPRLAAQGREPRLRRLSPVRASATTFAESITTSGRGSGCCLVRQFEAEEELPLKVVIDTSNSMGFYRKLEVSKVLAGMMTYLGLAGGDRVQLVRSPRMVL